LDISLDGKVAIVTGTGPNIGGGTALAPAKCGAKVACNDLSLDAAHLLEDSLTDFNRAITIAVNGNFLYTKYGALAKHWSYLPDTAAAAGPVPVIPLDHTVITLLARRDDPPQPPGKAIRERHG
jgi:NAD(P)-dependent dehydrogenase (short-subunit alcohol dehydrogenase family)